MDATSPSDALVEVENSDTSSPSDVDVLWKWRTGILLLLQMSMSCGSGEQGCCFSFRCRCLVELENRDAACSSDTLGVVHTTYEFKVMVPICLWLIQYLACCLKFVRAKLIPCAAVDVSGCTNLLIILHCYVCWLLQWFVVSWDWCNRVSNLPLIDTVFGMLLEIRSC